MERIFRIEREDLTCESKIALSGADKYVLCNTSEQLTVWRVEDGAEIFSKCADRLSAMFTSNEDLPVCANTSCTSSSIILLKRAQIQAPLSSLPARNAHVSSN